MPRREWSHRRTCGLGIYAAIGWTGFGIAIGVTLALLRALS